MPNKLSGGKKTDVTPEVTSDDVTPEVTSPVESVSKHDPNGTVMNGSAMPFRMNDYQKDIVDVCSGRMNLSKQAYIRLAILEYSLKKLGVR